MVGRRSSTSLTGVLNAVAGSLGLAIQAVVFLGVYLSFAPRRGRSLALLFAAITAVDGYALVVLGAMTMGIPWQAANVVLAVLAAASLASPRVRAVMTRPVSAFGRLLRTEWAALALVVAVVAFQSLTVVLLPELSIDGQLYHGPALAQLVQHGTVWGWSAPNQYMFYSDLAMVSATNLATFTGSTWFDNGAQIPHLVILMLVVNAALRGRFARSWTRLAFALLLVSAPVIWIQARILYVDIAYGAAVAALIVLIATNRRAAGSDVLFAAIAGASILAIKPTGLVTSAMLVLLLLGVSIWRRRRDRHGWGSSIGVTVASIAVPCVLALGFYIRNLLSFGNPVYPVKVEVGPLSLPGIVDLSVFASGERGSGLVDPLRWVTYVTSVLEGVRHGVTKLDYDPRSGGYGHLPLFVLLIVIGIVVAQLIVSSRRDRRANLSWRGNWPTQTMLIVPAAVVLLVQPSTFDTRYVMGPTVVLGVAALLTTVVRASLCALDLVAGALALVLAAGQIVWVEASVYPGIAALRELRSLPDVWQPVTPGNPWGRGVGVSWLPDDPTSCSRIVVQTEGGVGPAGMMERAALATLPYGLYGAALCNVVAPIQLEAAASGGLREDPLPTADFLVLYEDDIRRWEELVPELAVCWTAVQTVEGNESYPETVTVMRDACD